MASKVLIHREQSTGMQCVWVHCRIIYRGKNELISCCMVKVEVSQEFLWECYVKNSIKSIVGITQNSLRNLITI